MTDFLTRFSCLLDVGTAANAAGAFDIYAALMAENDREDPPAEPFLLSLTPEHGVTRLWLRDPGSADPQLLLTFVARCAEAFALTGRWGFQWAGIASNPVVDGFSGGAPCARPGDGTDHRMDEQWTLACRASCRWRSVRDLSPA